MRGHHHEIAAVGSVIVGLPADTHEIIRHRLDAIDQLGLSYAYVRPLVAFPESMLYRQQARTGTIGTFEQWDAIGFDSFPHGYPLVSPLPRVELAAYCGR